METCVPQAGSAQGKMASPKRYVYFKQVLLKVRWHLCGDTCTSSRFCSCKDGISVEMSCTSNRFFSRKDGVSVEMYVL